MDGLPVKRITLSNDLFFEEVRNHLDDGKHVIIPVSGKSMLPFLKHGDNVTIKPFSAEDLKLGYIVLALTKMGYMLHRIIRSSDNDVWLAGDGNLQQIEHVKVDDIIATVVSATRENKVRNVHSVHLLAGAYIWFLARPFRRIWNRIVR